VEKKSLVLLALAFSMPRHLQLGVKFNAKAFSGNKSVNFSSSREIIRCNWKSGSIEIYKSIYCFRKNETHSSVSFVLSPSKTFKKPIKHKKTGKYVIYLPLKDWSVLYFN